MNDLNNKRDPNSPNRDATNRHWRDGYSAARQEAHEQLKDAHSRLDARGIAMLDQHDIGARIEGLCKAWANEEREKARENERLRLAFNGAKLDALCWKTQSEKFESALRKIAEVCNGYGDEAGWACKHARETLRAMQTSASDVVRENPKR